MAQAQAAGIANELVGRLNVLRKQRAADSRELDQVRFRARGLEKKNHAAFLAVSSMIAALEGDAAAVQCYADEVAERYPFETQHVTNTIRSLIGVGAYEPAKSAIERFLESVADAEDASIGCYNFLLIGALTDARVWASRLNIQRQMPSRRLHETERVATALLDIGVSDEDMSAYLRNILGTMRGQGWRAPIMQLRETISTEVEAPAICRILIDAEAEDLLDVEDNLMSALYSSEDKVYTNGFVITSIMTAAAYV
jgi:NAD(P)-dependent dehydrogenase (short-subunit alcohol dehydrogenase family)